MRPKPFDTEKIRKLLLEDRIELAIEVLVDNLKNVLNEANEVLGSGETVLNSGLAFLIPPKIKQIISEFRNTIIILSASIKRIEKDFRNQIIEYSTRHKFRNTIINSMNSLLTDLDKFNYEYGELFPSERQFMPSPNEPNFLDKARVYISIMKSLSQKVENLSQIKNEE